MNERSKENAFPLDGGANGANDPNGAKRAVSRRGVLGVLLTTLAVAALWAAIQGGREAWRRANCAVKLKMIAVAMQAYCDANGVLPPAYTVDEAGRPLHSWRVLILPHLESSPLYREIRLDEPWDSEWNSRFHSLPVSPFACPSRVAALPNGAPITETTYSVVVGNETAFPGVGKWRKWEDFADGLAQTLCVVERKTPVCWMDPTQELTLETFAAELANEHKGRKSGEGGALAATFDLAVRFVPASTDAATLKGAATVAGGEKKVEFEQIEPRFAAD
ncbi:MAG: DUF1559 domain-containing protein [Thermoguttaceae bacterium]|nr:DUF1559 domain-containing protein [Thermoguttaceae bacterium]